MRKAFIAALLVSAGSLFGPAYATDNQHCYGNQCGGNHDGDIYRRGGNANAGAIAGALSNAENHNRNIAKGGDAAAFSNSSSDAKVDNNFRNTNKQSQYQSTESNAYSSSSSDNANNASQNVNFEAQERAPVNTAYAAPLVAGEDTCMGSSSIGGQGVGFGISIGTTWTDENCQRLKNSRQLAAIGLRKASIALLCVNDDVARAMEAAGTPCRVQNGGSWALSTASLVSERVYAPPQVERRVVFSRVVEDRPLSTPKKYHKPKKARCRLVRQCTR